MIRVVHPGLRVLIFYPSRIPDPGVKKAADPGSGSATLVLKFRGTAIKGCCRPHSFYSWYKKEIREYLRKSTIQYCAFPHRTGVIIKISYCIRYVSFVFYDTGTFCQRYGTISGNAQYQYYPISPTSSLISDKPNTMVWGLSRSLLY